MHEEIHGLINNSCMEAALARFSQVTQKFILANMSLVTHQKVKHSVLLRKSELGQGMPLNELQLFSVHMCS